MWIANAIGRWQIGAATSSSQLIEAGFCCQAQAVPQRGQGWGVQIRFARGPVITTLKENLPTQAPSRRQDGQARGDSTGGAACLEGHKPAKARDGTRSCGIRSRARTVRSAEAAPALQIPNAPLALRRRCRIGRFPPGNVRTYVEINLGAPFASTSPLLI